MLGFLLTDCGNVNQNVTESYTSWLWGSAWAASECKKKWNKFDCSRQDLNGATIQTAFIVWQNSIRRLPPPSKICEKRPKAITEIHLQIKITNNAFRHIYIYSNIVCVCLGDFLVFRLYYSNFNVQRLKENIYNLYVWSESVKPFLYPTLLEINIAEVTVLTVYYFWALR